MGTAFGVLATAVSGVFAAALLRRCAARGGGNRALLYWGVALALFCVASFALTIGSVAGWSATVYRAFYLFGAVLTVPWLAMGTIQAISRDRVVARLVGATSVVVALLLVVPMLRSETPLRFAVAVVVGLVWGALLLAADEHATPAGALAVLGVLTAVATVSVLSAALTPGMLPTDDLPSARDLFPAAVRGFSFAGNVVGALIVVLGAVASAVRQRRPETRHLAVGNLLIALGVLIAAGTGVYAGLVGEVASHAVALGVGVTAMYLGFVRTTRPASSA